jgi:hypothetical protein
MKYAHYDLGEQQEGTTVLIRLRGSAANVLLLDAVNFSCYARGEHFVFTGGFSRHSPVRLSVPHAGHWHVVLDLGGYRGHVRGHVTVLTPENRESRRAVVSSG